MAALYNHIIEVSGKSVFPVDMLRYDGLSPHSEPDSYRITEMIQGVSEPTVIKLIHVGYSNWKPTRFRWESFGWKVISHNKEHRF